MQNTKKGTKRVYRKIYYEDRETIQEMLKNGEEFEAIATAIGCSLVTILMEYNRGRQSDGTYSAIEAQKKVTRG